MTPVLSVDAFHVSVRLVWVAPEATISGIEDEYLLAGARPKLIYLRKPAASRDAGPDPRGRRAIVHCGRTVAGDPADRALGRPRCPDAGPGLPVPPASVAAAPPWPGARKTGRRLAFARWLVRPEHPLTARVMVNRLWKQHFGRGIVPTLGNFGTAGAAPTHPELLDWLATEFVRSGWSVKEMHRVMVTSSAYRQRSAVTPDLAAIDPDNAFVSRMPLVRQLVSEWVGCVEFEEQRGDIRLGTEYHGAKGPQLNTSQNPDEAVALGAAIAA